MGGIIIIVTYEVSYGSSIGKPSGRLVEEGRAIRRKISLSSAVFVEMIVSCVENGVAKGKDGRKGGRRLGQSHGRGKKEQSNE